MTKQIELATRLCAEEPSGVKTLILPVGPIYPLAYYLPEEILSTRFPNKQTNEDNQKRTCAPPTRGEVKSFFDDWQNG